MMRRHVLKSIFCAWLRGTGHKIVNINCLFDIPAHQKNTLLSKYNYYYFECNRCGMWASFPCYLYNNISQKKFRRLFMEGVADDGYLWCNGVILNIIHDD
jgi:hypothetical protein